jgi:hypothetical protein
MGGPGSGPTEQWWRPKRRTVEACAHLDAAGLWREGAIQPGRTTSGSLGYVYPGGDRVSLAYRAEADECRGVVHLGTASTWTGQDVVAYRAELVATRNGFRGLLWYCLCPLTAGGVTCGRRVRKLYLPPRERFFGCRVCHDLSYVCCQENTRRSILGKMDRSMKRIRVLEAELAAVEENVLARWTGTP